MTIARVGAILKARQGCDGPEAPSARPTSQPQGRTAQLRLNEGAKPWRALDGVWLGQPATAVLDKHGHTLFFIRNAETAREIVSLMNNNGRN